MAEQYNSVREARDELARAVVDSYEKYEKLLKRVKRIEEVLVETGTVGDLCFTPYKEDPK